MFTKYSEITKYIYVLLNVVGVLLRILNAVSLTLTVKLGYVITKERNNTSEINARILDLATTCIEELQQYWFSAQGK
jgi:hypothetical protein